MEDEKDLQNPILEQQQEELDPRLQQALAERDRLRKNADLLQGFKKMSEALAQGTGFQADLGMVKELRKRENDPVKKYQALLDQIKSKKQEQRQAHKDEIADERWKLNKKQMEQSIRSANMKAKEMGIKLDQLGNLNDPNHKMAQILRADLQQREYKKAKAEGRDPLQIPEGMSFWELNHLDDLYDKGKDLNELDLLRIDLKKKQLAETQARHEDRMELKRKSKLDKDVEAISKRLEKNGIIEQKNSFKNIDDYLLKQGGVLGRPETYKKISIPGMGVGGGLRPDFITPKDAVQFRQNVQSLANQLLKQRSGAAVTDQEYRRFLKEVGSGNFSSEENLMTGLAKMKKDLEDRESNIINAADPDAKKEYMRRMGIIEDDIKGMSSDFVTLESPDGQRVRVKKDKVEKYLKKGAKIVE